MGRPLTLVVFDVDGTLVDSQAHILAAMAAGFAAAGLPVPPAGTVLSIVGLSLPVAVARLVPDLDTETQDRIVEGYKASFAMQRANTASPLYPGAADALTRLSAREDVLLGVATGKSRRGLTKVLGAHALEGLFATVQTADDHPSKPHPAMVHAALGETGVSADRAVIVGDTTFDMEMGRAGGIHAIGVSWGYHPASALVGAGARVVLPEFAALDAALGEIWGDWA